MPGLLADSGGFISFLIYFVIAVIWVIGKVMQQRDARRRIQDLKARREEREREEQRTGKPYTAPERPSSPPPRPAPAPAKSLEDELQEFLGRLAGVEPETPKPEYKPEPIPAPKPQPQPQPQYKKPLIQFDSAPPPPPRKPVHPPLQRVPEDMDAIAAYAHIADIEDIKELELDPDKASFGGPDVLMNVRAMMIDLSSISVKIPTVHIPTLRTSHGKTTPPDIGTTEALKQAVLSGILLSPPKALQADPFHNEPGQL